MNAPRREPVAGRAASADLDFMRQALRLARRGYGFTSPNPMVGAVLVGNNQVLGRGWHRRAGEAHAEIEALNDARRRGAKIRGATLYVTLEPCCTQGRTPPCTDALKAARLKRVVVAAQDPNPKHAGKGLRVLRRAGIEVVTGVLEDEAIRLNEAYNHWIVSQRPFVTVKSAMTLDGKIATASGESKWITGERTRAWAMKLRLGADAILTGVNTVLADDPALTVRMPVAGPRKKILRRVILDSRARTPLSSRVVSDPHAAATVIVVGKAAPRPRVEALRRRVTIWRAPERNQGLDLRWLLRKLGAEGVTSLLIEGGERINAGFLLQGLAHRVAFFYAPKVLGGADAYRAVGGKGVTRSEDVIELRDVEWRQLGEDLFMTARVG